MLLFRRSIFLFLGYITGFSGFAQPAVLKFESFKHYADRFNTMEDEPIVQAIPNSESWQWMQKNIPLLETPDKNFEEIFYFRWWTLRKHIRKTEQGFALTEFLVQRSYADKYNLISSGLGHHIYESRWLHDQQYLDDNLRIWYRGNDGKPFKKLRAYSSWNMDAIYNRYLVNGNAQFVKDYYPDLTADYAGWESENVIPEDFSGSLMYGMQWKKPLAADGKKRTPGPLSMVICMAMPGHYRPLQNWQAIQPVLVYIREKQIALKWKHSKSSGIQKVISLKLEKRKATHWHR
ncbi:hypothetical protein KRR40_43070 [Niabella defluvii]|nr:hypothetical protein KRR40_43070 [Niabella sp. I65]